MSNIEFSPCGYADLIKALLSINYEIRNFADVNPEKCHLVVRHDVDFSLGAACAMAEVEATLGIKATYFILLRTEFYNPLSAEGSDAINRIIELGHGVGLHFDASLYPNDAVEVERAAASECLLLEGIVGASVSAISFHRPTHERIGQNNEIAGRLNVYGARYFKEMGYCSDSTGAWRYGAPLDHNAVRNGRALQLLIHPFWWQAPALPPQERLQKFLCERSIRLDQELEKQCVVHRHRAFTMLD